MLLVGHISVSIYDELHVDRVIYIVLADIILYVLAKLVFLGSKCTFSA